jgi:hypothetical protein
MMNEHCGIENDTSGPYGDLGVTAPARSRWGQILRITLRPTKRLDRRDLRRYANSATNEPMR